MFVAIALYVLVFAFAIVMMYRHRGRAKGKDEATFDDDILTMYLLLDDDRHDEYDSYSSSVYDSDTAMFDDDDF